MFRDDNIITLDIGSSKIVLAEFSAAKSRGVELLNYGIARLGVETDAASSTSAFIVSAIRDLMRAQGIKPAPMLMTVSGQAVFPRFVKLPPVERDKLLQIIQYEAEQNVPFPIREVVWDYQLIGGREGDLNVMLVAVKIENVKRLTDCAVGAGLEPEIVDAAPMALYNTVRYNYPDLAGCTMVLDIGCRASNLIFLEGARIFSRSIPVAGNAITQELSKEFGVSVSEAEEMKLKHGFVSFGGVYSGPNSEVADRASRVVRNVITRLHAEVNRSINFYRSQQGGSAPTRILLTGGSSVIPHLDRFFKEKLKVDADYLNPFVNVSVSRRIGVERIRADYHLLGEAVGLALRRALKCPVEINLMPPDLVAKKVFRRRQPFFALAIIGVALTMLCWWGYFHRMSRMMGTRVEKVQAKADRLEDVHKRLSRVKEARSESAAKTDRVIDLIRERTQWIEILDAIHACMPEGMWLTSVQPVVEDRSCTHVEITGSGFVDKLVDKPDASAIELFRNRLRTASFFGDGTEIRRQPPVGSGAYAREFTIRAALKKPIKIR